MNYSVKIWVCTLLSAPVLLMIYGVLTSTDNPVSFLEGFFGIAVLMFVFGFMLSTPSLIIFWLIFDLLAERIINAYIKKIVMSFTGVFLIFTSFLIMDRDMFDRGDWSSLLFPVCYSIALLFSVFLFKITSTSNVTPEFQNENIDS